MIKRIVKMSFQPDQLEAFKTIFEQNKHRIAAFEGCQHVELLQDINNPCIFFTYSLWDNADYLELYRQSEIFAEIWVKTKRLFSQRAEAWSLVIC